MADSKTSHQNYSTNESPSRMQIIPKTETVTNPTDTIQGIKAAILENIVMINTKPNKTNAYPKPFELKFGLNVPLDNFLSL
jgi:hypothetical protein